MAMLYEASRRMVLPRKDDSMNALALRALLAYIGNYYTPEAAR